MLNTLLKKHKQPEKKIKANLHAHLSLIINPACTLCDASIEDVKHYFLHCPRFAALREKVFASAANYLEKDGIVPQISNWIYLTNSTYSS